LSPSSVSTEPLDLMFRAFSDSTRLRIVHLLQHEGGELCVGDIVTILRVPQPRASRHLSYLRRAGILDVREKGLWKFYRLTPARTAFHRKLLECLAVSTAELPVLGRDRARARALTKRCCE
jgi:ArsR family transcriptional regulator, arsenate/arsenite/antimonite-responsive transcriptional repressor